MYLRGKFCISLLISPTKIFADISDKDLVQNNRGDFSVIVLILDLRLAIDPSPRGNFLHYDFLKLQYISHKIRHVSPLRVEALSCNNNITYVTL